jgi:peroxiredoxin (alkyl hydroperoxide reductase subunit C)
MDGERSAIEMTSSDSSPLQLGAVVPNFELAVYDPVKNDFGTFSLEQNKSQGKWTILFFYPADFTFV